MPRIRYATSDGSRSIERVSAFVASLPSEMRVNAPAAGMRSIYARPRLRNACGPVSGRRVSCSKNVIGRRSRKRDGDLAIVGGYSQVFLDQQ